MLVKIPVASYQSSVISHQLPVMRVHEAHFDPRKSAQSAVDISPSKKQLCRKKAQKAQKINHLQR
jgi:hypothetical protein